MQNRLLGVFAVGVLAGALLLGGGVFALQTFGSSAEAQSGATWQTKYWNEGRINNGVTTPNPERYLDDWVNALPVECDFLFAGDARNVVFYRCPVS